jgi:hypothetical protein
MVTGGSVRFRHSFDYDRTSGLMIDLTTATLLPSARENAVTFGDDLRSISAKLWEFESAGLTSKRSFAGHQSRL